MPAPIEEEDYTSVLSMALRTHRALGCKDISRVDFILHGGVFHILELNTHPGMTPLSLVPEIAAHAGISFPHILRYLIDNAAYRT